MHFLQIDSIISLSNNQGFWDNFIWPLAVAGVLGIIALIRQYVLSIRKKKELNPTLNLIIDERSNISLKEDKNVISKLILIKQLVRTNRTAEFNINLKPSFKTGKLNEFQKQELKLKLEEKSKEIKSKIEILFFKPIDISLEYSPEGFKEALGYILKRRPSDVTNRTKIQVYREFDPKIYFPVYLSKDEVRIVAESQNKTIDNLKRELRIPTMCSISIFPKEVFLSQIVPEFVNEIYRIKSNHNFKLSTKHWESLFSYEVVID